MKFVCVILLALVVTSECKKAEGLYNCGDVYLTVSAFIDKFIELHWATNCRKKELPDKIELYNVNPNDEGDKPMLTINTTKHEGYFRTYRVFELDPLPGGWDLKTLKNKTKIKPGPICYRFWIASVKNGDTIRQNCLAIQPTWMGDNRESIKHKKLAYLVIPGTHNSGSYGSKFPEFLDRFRLTQDTDIWSQLVFGIRYLDLHVNFDGDGFVINRDTLTRIKLKTVLGTVKKFLDLATDEVVILDFQKLEKADDYKEITHRKLIRLIYSQLKDYIIPFNPGITMEDIWEQNKRVVVCYTDNYYQQQFPWLWNPVLRFESKNRNLPKLKSFLNHAIFNHKYSNSRPLWSINIFLAHTPFDLLDITWSNRNLAHMVNRKFPIWFTHDLVNEVTIVATNYFLGNNFIEIAILANTFEHKDN